MGGALDKAVRKLNIRTKKTYDPKNHRIKTAGPVDLSETIDPKQMYFKLAILIKSDQSVSTFTLSGASLKKYADAAVSKEADEAFNPGWNAAAEDFWVGYRAPTSILSPTLDIQFQLETFPSAYAPSGQKIVVVYTYDGVDFAGPHGHYAYGESTLVAIPGGAMASHFRPGKKKPRGK